jgi:hypothetical protein
MGRDFSNIFTTGAVADWPGMTSGESRSSKRKGDAYAMLRLFGRPHSQVSRTF